jgi:predicted amidohydrolase
LRIGVFQFSGSGDIDQNAKKISDTIKDAAAKNIRLLVFQECALCGYPPIETPDVHLIDYEKTVACLSGICDLAKQYKMYIAVGTVRTEGRQYNNSIQLIGENGSFAGCYDKRALWGWDTDNYSRGENPGIFIIDGIRVGFRICYEVRFPEYFRELYAADVPLCFVSFCDVGSEDDPQRYNVIKSHLITRAVENTMTVVSVNSISHYQTAPTAVFDCDGEVLLEAPKNEETLLVYDFSIPEITYFRQGRIVNSNRLTRKDK